MKTYDDIDEAWVNALSDLKVDGSRELTRNGFAIELLNYSFQLKPPAHSVLQNSRRRWNAQFACAELLWYLSRSDEVKHVTPYAPQYDRFAEDGVAWGAYGARWALPHRPDQLELALQLIKLHPRSRQIIVTMWSAMLDQECVEAGSHGDLPCTISFQFQARRGALHMTTTMRSNDVWLGTPYDVFSFTCLWRLLAGEAGLSLGSYTHQVGNMHLYEKYEERASEAIYASRRDVTWREWECSCDWSRIPRAVALERSRRERTVEESIPLPRRGLLHDVVSCALSKWCSSYVNEVYNPVLMEVAKCSS